MKNSDNLEPIVVELKKIKTRRETSENQEEPLSCEEQEIRKNEAEEIINHIKELISQNLSYSNPTVLQLFGESGAFAESDIDESLNSAQGALKLVRENETFAESDAAKKVLEVA